MNSKSKEHESKPAESTIDGPGSQLRKARERLGLEQSKVAAHLHLSRAIVQALEWDDYENLPSAVFVKGYLRNYARLVKVDEDAVVSAFLELHPTTEQNPLPKSQPEDVAKELHGDPRLFRYITWAVVLILGVMVFFWWQGRIDEPETVLDTQEEETELLPGFSDSLELSNDKGELDLTLPPAAESAAESEVTTSYQANPSEPVEVPPITEPDTYASSPEPSQTETVTDRARVFETPISEPMSSAAAQTPQMADSTPVESTLPSGSLVFEFIDECWVDVRDAAGNIRILGVKGQGLRRILNTNAGPFKVVIGDINAVRVSVNGAAYDLKAHARGKVARFTLDPSQL